MATVRDLIKGSLRLLGVLASGEAPDADMQADGLSVLNEMLDSWSTESLAVYTMPSREVSLTAGQGSYTIGTSGDLAISRPLKVKAAYAKQGSTETPIEILSLNEWAAVSPKDTQGTIPTKIYFEGSYPLQTMKVWPVPSEAVSIVLYSWEPLTSFTNASNDIEFPPGYLKALRFNLAIALAPEYGVPAPNEVVMEADRAKRNIERMNAKPLYLESNPMSRGRGYDYRTGE